MTTRNYTTQTYDVNHSAFGGEIEIDDFNTTCPYKNRINNQITASNLHNAIKDKQNKKDNERKYKNMTLEELKEMKIVSNTTGRPTSTLTDEKWQKEILVRKLFVTPYKKTVRRLGGRYSKESSWNNETMGEYYGTTNWIEYCSFINDVLKNIRSGQIDYCYYIYQIIDLLKFHYNDLKTRYCDGYWEVWLER